MDMSRTHSVIFRIRTHLMSGVDNNKLLKKIRVMPAGQIFPRFIGRVFSSGQKCKRFYGMRKKNFFLFFHTAHLNFAKL